MARIEIREPDGVSISAVYFPIPSLIRKYWTNSKITDLRENILFPPSTEGRKSIEEKVKTFLNDGKYLLATLRHFESLDEYANSKNVIYFLGVNIAKKMSFFNFLTLIVTVVLNGLMLYSLKDSVGGSYHVSGDIFVTLMMYFGYVHLATSGMTLFCFFILNGLLYIKEGSKDNEECILELDGLAAALLGPLLRLTNGIDSAGDQNKRVRLTVWHRFLQVMYFFDHFDTKYYCALTIFSALGVFRSPLFFACCFIEILRISKLMQYVMRAFTANIDQVIAAVILAALVTYLFSVSAYSSASLHNHFNFNSFGGSCSSLKSCTLVALDYGYSQSVFWDYPAAIGTVEGSVFNFAFTFILQVNES